MYRVPPPTTAAERADPWLGLEIVAELPSSRALVELETKVHTKIQSRAEGPY